MAITIPEELQSFVSRSVASGRFRSEDEAVTEALRLLQYRETKLDAVVADLQVGFEPVSSPDWLTDQANAAFRVASKKVILEARQSNTKIIVWKNGKVCHLSPDEAEQDLKQQSGEDVS